MWRSLPIAVAVAALGTAGCQGGGAHDAASVSRAFRAEGISLRRNRDLERGFRASHHGLEDKLVGVLAGGIPDPQAIFSGPDNLFVAVMPRPMTVGEALGGVGETAAALEAQGMRLFRRDNVLAMAGAEQPRRLRQIRAALGRMR